MDLINELCDLLQTHANRDKIVSLTCYVLKLWGSSSGRQPLLTASARLAGARATLRLFDDATAVKAALAYGFGGREGPLWGTLGVASSLFTLGYLQAEKAVWLIDTGVLAVSKDIDFNIKTTHKLLWSLSAFVGFIRSIHALHMCAEELRSPKRRRCSPARFTQATLVCTKLALDVVHAVSWLPAGWLWGARLTTQRASAVATASAVMALIIHYHGKRLAKAR